MNSDIKPKSVELLKLATTIRLIQQDMSPALLTMLITGTPESELQTIDDALPVLAAIAWAQDRPALASHMLNTIYPTDQQKSAAKNFGQFYDKASKVVQDALAEHAAEHAAEHEHHCDVCASHCNEPGCGVKEHGY